MLRLRGTRLRHLFAPKMVTVQRMAGGPQRRETVKAGQQIESLE
jgi:hypothetical protein